MLPAPQETSPFLLVVVIDHRLQEKRLGVLRKRTRQRRVPGQCRQFGKGIQVGDDALMALGKVVQWSVHYRIAWGVCRVHGLSTMLVLSRRDRVAQVHP